ncbi:lipoprotein insertase outer membrane protein LolB [Bordetella bronchialis]|uniref:Outer-membrane lipoprotein LolB n=1 Tax=Bordetella bronchialis TaxID=463025 RepID=A0A193FRW1_9BORD|nr:lipoprotein localization factor LolB [Bordetella bronchialis]
MTLSRWRAVLAAALCLVLAACVTPGRIAGNGGAGEFSRVGRFALTVTQDDGKQDALQGGFSWLDDGRRYILDLTNPLGSTQARVEGRPGMAVLNKSDGTRLQARNPDELVADALGSSIPVSGLRDWLRGRLPAEPPANHVERDPSQRPVSFDQGGWQARLSRYDDLGPQLLVLERREPDRRILLRLVVNPS